MLPCWCKHASPTRLTHQRQFQSTLFIDHIHARARPYQIPVRGSAIATQHPERQGTAILPLPLRTSLPRKPSLNLLRARMGKSQSKPIPFSPSTTSCTQSRPELVEISPPATRRELRTLSMLVDPMELAQSVDGGQRTTGSSSQEALVGATLPFNASDHPEPATMFDFERPLCLRERRERVTARLEALQMKKHPECKCDLGCGCFNVLRRFFGL